MEQNSAALPAQRVALEEALGCVLAEDIRAPIFLPVFHNSAMDGYVFRCRETAAASAEMPLRFRIAGVIKAGDPPKRLIPPNCCYQIMTGACIPGGGDAVLAQEEAVVRGKNLFLAKPLRRGRHIRVRGEEVKKGERVLGKFAVLHPGNVGILATFGKARVKVFRKPKIFLIATGSELTPPGKRLKPGKIYDSNSRMLRAALRHMGLPAHRVRTVRDRPGDLRRAIRQGLRGDCLILAGGVSVGDYDYCKAILQELGVRTLFWQVSQKPGKPLYLGKKGATLVFGLPGNPASVFLCFYEYVFPALRRMSGHRHPYLRRENLLLEETIPADEKKTMMLKAKAVQNGKGRAIAPLSRQGSHMLSSLRDTNSVILLPPKKGVFRKGEYVTGDLLPQEDGV